MSDQREALLLRARRRIEERKLYQKVLLQREESDTSVDGGNVPRIKLEPPIPASSPAASSARYRRMSLNSIPAFDANFNSTPLNGGTVRPFISPAHVAHQRARTMENSNIVNVNVNEEQKLKRDLPPLKVDIKNSSMAATPKETNFQSDASLKDTPLKDTPLKKTPQDINKSLEKLLEKGVSFTPLVDDFAGVSLVPASPRIESEQEVKRKMILMKRGKKVKLPDDAPIKEEEIQEITELGELYSSNSSLTLRTKWFTTPKKESMRIFTYPSPYTTPNIAYPMLSPLDGFYVPDTPIISTWNYDRLVRRLQKTEPDGNWFSGVKTVAIDADPVNHNHYKLSTVDQLEWIDSTDSQSSLERVKATITKPTPLLMPTTLIVDLSGLYLDTHPLMLEEHVLEKTMIDLVEIVESRIRSQLIQFLALKVDSLQQSYTDLKQQFEVLKRSKTFEGDLKSPFGSPGRRVVMGMGAQMKLRQKIIETRGELMKLCKEVLAARQLRDTEAQTSRLLEYRIVKTWDKIKGVRIAQGFTSTFTKLVVKTTNRNKWCSGGVDIRKQVDEDMFFRKELYELEHSFINQFGSVEELDKDDDQASLLKKKMGVKVEFNEIKVRENAIRNLKASFPKQPELEFRLEQTSTVTATIECPHVRPDYAEQVRRHSAEASKFFLVIYYNGSLVTRTIPKAIDAKYSIAFQNVADLNRIDTLPHIEKSSKSARFVLSVRDTPRNFKIHVYESGVLGDSFVSEVFVPLPPIGETASTLDRKVGQVEFTGTGSGNGIQGKVHINLAWGDNPHTIRSTKRGQSDPLSFHGPAGILNLPAMIEWILKVNFDPNDPRNSDLMKIRELIDSVVSSDTISLSSWNSIGFFRVGLPAWLHKITLGLGPDNLEKYDARFKTLIQRFRRELVYNGPVPMNPEELDHKPPSNTNAYRDKTESNLLQQWGSRYSLKDGDTKGVDLGFLKRIRDLQLIRKNALILPRHVDDFVSEARLDPPPDQEFDLFYFFRPFRPLNPYRTNRKNMVARDADHCKLVIQLISGINLPTRLDTFGTKLKPFVELSFQKKKTRSTTSDGPTPVWNQTLAVEIEAPDGDFRPENLMESDITTELIYINLFDEITVDLLQDDRQRDREMYIRKEKVWLGSIEIPFSSVWERSRIDGKFPIYMPPTLLGYGHQTGSDEIIKIDVQDIPLLHIFVTLDPPLVQPPELKLKFQTDESPELIQSALKWQEWCLSVSKPCIAVTHDMTGKSALVCRYIRPQNPPFNLLNVHQVARFVSSIPFLPSRTVFSVICNLWATSDQVLNVGAGDSIEHAILLCNYLLSLDYEAKVLFGRGLVDSKAHFVVFKNKEGESVGSNSLTVKKNQQLGLLSYLGSIVNLRRNPSGFEESIETDYRICDPVTGSCFQISDRRLPLEEIYGVFNDKNIWSNVQAEKRVDKTNFDVSDIQCWKSFNPVDHLPSIQPGILDYSETSQKWIQELELNLERMIVNKFEEWRKGNTTRWNRLCSRSFKALLSRFEDDIVAGVDLNQSIQQSSELNSIQRVYKLSGHPMSLAYTDGIAICNSIFSKGIHENVTEGVEFALGIHCNGYPGRFVNVHVFLASLVRKGKAHKYKLDVSKTNKRGLEILHDPLLNKGSAFSKAERVQTIQDQFDRNMKYFEYANDRITNSNQSSPEELKEFKDLSMYRDLGALADRNETLFYRILMDNFKELAPIIYTPTVGQACLKSHTIYRQARGMYFSVNDRGHLSSMVHNWPHEVKVIVVTDGSRVLGLGDLGANGMPISVGKLNLYCAAGGINPKSVLPVVLDVGTNNAALRDNPLYLGLPQPRLEGDEYYEFIDEWLHAVYSKWPRVLVQFEDFKNPHAQNILNKYRKKFCVFNDDIQSTGAIALAGVFSSLKARGKSFKDIGKETIVCAGAGSAGIGVCEAIVEGMLQVGAVSSKEEGYSKFHLVDQNGLIGATRSPELLSDLQKPFVRKDQADGMPLLDVIKSVNPTILLGLSGCGGLFTKEMIQHMAQVHDKPVILPLSNPTKNSEATAHDVFSWSDGKALFASGSPFQDVAISGKLYPTSQCNNYYIFPGVGLGILNCLPSEVPDAFFQEAAMIIASKSNYMEDGRLFPEVQDIRSISLDIAVRVCEISVELGIATQTPPRGKTWREVISTRMWDPQFYNPIVAV